MADNTGAGGSMPPGGIPGAMGGFDLSALQNVLNVGCPTDVPNKPPFSNVPCLVRVPVALLGTANARR